MSTIEPMDVDDIESDFDNKENTCRGNVLLKTQITEKGHEESNVSDLNSKLRYSGNNSSPMSRSFTIGTTIGYSDRNDTENGNLAQSLGPIYGVADAVTKSPKLPLKVISADSSVDNNRNPLGQSTSNNAGIALTVDEANDSDENISFPSSSSSSPSTPIPTTPTKDILKPTGSPIMRGLRSVLNIFRSSQSPITLAEDQFAQCKDDAITSLEVSNETSANKTHILASTPIASSRMDRISQRISPLKESIVFNEELSRNDLQWHNDTTIIFSEERIPVHKLFQDAPLPSTTSINVDNNTNKYAEINNRNASHENDFNMSIEPMDISYNKSMVKENTLTGVNILSESELLSDTRRDDSVFVDCESTFEIQNETELLKSLDNSYVSPLEGSDGDEINLPDDLEQNTEQSSTTNLDKLVESVHIKSSIKDIDITGCDAKSDEKLSVSYLKNKIYLEQVKEVAASNIEDVEPLNNKQTHHEENDNSQSTKIHPELCSNSVTYFNNTIPAPTSEHTTDNKQLNFEHICDSENTLINSPENVNPPTSLNLDLKFDSTLDLNNANDIENNDFMKNDNLESNNSILCQAEDFVNDTLKRYIGNLDNGNIRENVDAELHNTESNVMLNQLTEIINLPEMNVAHTEQIPICNFDVRKEIIEIDELSTAKSNILYDNDIFLKESVQETAVLSANQQEDDNSLDQDDKCTYNVEASLINQEQPSGINEIVAQECLYTSEQLTVTSNLSKNYEEEPSVINEIVAQECLYTSEQLNVTLNLPKNNEEEPSVINELLAQECQDTFEQLNLTSNLPKNNEEEPSVINDIVAQECQDTCEQLNLTSNHPMNNEVVHKESILETSVPNKEIQDEIDNNTITGNENSEFIKGESVTNKITDQNNLNDGLNLIENKQDVNITDKTLCSSEHLLTGTTYNDLRDIKVSNESNSIELLGISQYGINPLQVNDVKILSNENNIQIDTLPLHDIADRKSSEHTIVQSVDDTSNVHIQNPEDEEIVVSYNNSPFVSVHEGDNTKLRNFDDVQSTIDTKTEIRKSISSTHINKETSPSINFEDIENPFATKSKMRMSPPPSSLYIEKTGITKSILVHHPNDEYNNKKIITASACEDIEVKANCDNSSKICMSLETKKDVLDINNKQIEKMEQTLTGTVCNDNSDENVNLSKTMVTFEDNVKSCNKLLLENETNTIVTSDIPRQDTNVSSSEQSVYLSADASSGEGVSVSRDPLFELKRSGINDSFHENKVCESSTINYVENDNTFICQSENSLSPETTIILTNDDIQVSNTNVANVTLSTEGCEGAEDENKMKQSVSNVSMVSESITNNKDIIVDEVNSEDEDTLEGPFLEVENFTDLGEVNYDKADLNPFDDANADDEHFESGEMFIDADAFDFLMNQNGNNVMDNGKESLFLKFDPLCATKAKVNDGGVAALLRNTQIKVPPQHLEHNETSTLNLTFGDTVSEESLDDLNATVSQKPTMAVIPAVNNETVVMSRNIPETPIRSNRQSMTFNSPAIAVIDQLISLSANNSLSHYDMTVTRHVTQQNEAESTLIQLRQLLADREENIHNLRCESIELQTRLSTLQTQLKVLESDNEGKLKRIKELNETLVDKTKINKNMALVMEEYERTIAGLIADTEQEKKRHAEERIQLIKERDEQTTHLTSMEVSFSDLHTKYEKSKQIILSYKANQDKCKTSLAEFEENLKKRQNSYELLKQHATAKLNHANQELEKINKAHESEVLKLNAMIKRKDVHINSLEETLIQKTKANEELSAICDELLNKV